MIFFLIAIFLLISKNRIFAEVFHFCDFFQFFLASARKPEQHFRLNLPKNFGNYNFRELATLPVSTDPDCAFYV
jgi:hypothetical protein